MDDPLEIDIISEECPNLETLKIMLSGVWENSHKTYSHFPKLNKIHLKTVNPETLLSFMRYNVSVKEMKISCPNEGKSKFTDAFIQNVCSFKGLLPSLKILLFLSKFPFGFISAQKLIECLISLEYIGPMEMFTKLSKPDVNDIVNWVKENNWNVVIGYKGVLYNVFNLDQSDPWKHKYIPDVGRVPVKKEKPVFKRLLSVPSRISDDEDDNFPISDGRKRSRTNSIYFPPSQCSTRKSGSVISVKKSNGSNRTSINLDNEDFEFEFAMDSDGFIKNKDYKLYNNKKPMIENDEDYDDYDDFDEDTMDVEDLPEDAEFEWCWGEDGNLQINEIDRFNKQEELELGNVGETLLKEEQDYLANNETEMSIGETNIKVVDEARKSENIYDIQKEMEIAELLTVKSAAEGPEINNEDGNFIENSASLFQESKAGNSSKSSKRSKSDKKSKSVSGTKSKATGKTKTISPAISGPEEVSSSSRRALKRIAQVSPPPNNDDKTKPSETCHNVGAKIIGSGSSQIPIKAAKPDMEPSKSVKIASMFEKQNNNMQLSNNKTMNNVAKPSLPNLAEQTKKNAIQPTLSIKTQIIEVFEFDPLLGYCTVKRKTVPINDTETTIGQNSNSVNLQSSISEYIPGTSCKEEESEQNVLIQSISEANKQSEKTTLSSSGTNESTNSLAPNDVSGPSSNTSSKENKVPNKQISKKKLEEGPKPLVPLSSISKYDIPFIGTLLAANMSKSIPEPPKSKPPSLPDSVGKSLMLPKFKRSVSESEPKPVPDPKPVTEKKPSSTADMKVKVEVLEEKKPVVDADISKQEKPSTSKANSSKQGEAGDWYWDYEENCWRVCDPDEEYEWEYIESDEEKNEKNVKDQAQTTSPSVKKGSSGNKGDSLVGSKSSLDNSSVGTDKEQLDLHKEASEYEKSFFK